MKHDWVMWGSLATAAAAVCSFLLALISLAGIRLANRGVRVSERSTLLARRDYLDKIIANILNCASEFAAKGNPHWTKEYHSPSKEYDDFHLSYTNLQVALDMLFLSGMSEVRLSSRADPSDARLSSCWAAENNLGKISEAIERMMDAYYQCLIYPLNEDREAVYTFDEVWNQITNSIEWDTVPEISQRRIKEIFEIARQRAQSSAEQNDDPGDLLSTAASLTDHIVTLLVSDLMFEYKLLVDEVAPWNSLDKEKFWRRSKEALQEATISIFSRAKIRMKLASTGK